MRVPVSMLACAVLVACAALRPTPQPAPVPASPAAVKRNGESAPAIPVLNTENQEQKRAQIRQTLAKDERSAPTYSDLGYYLDVLQGRLNQSIGPGIAISRDIDCLRIDLAHRLKFAADGVQLSGADRESLVSLASVLAEYKATLVSVRVSAGDANSETVRLANLRAQTLARYLLESGVASKHVVIISAQPGSANKGSPSIELVLEPILRRGQDQR